MDSIIQTVVSNSDGSYAISADDALEVFKALHLAQAVRYSDIEKLKAFKEAMWSYKQSNLDAILSNEERELLENEMESDYWEALARHTMHTIAR